MTTRRRHVATAERAISLEQLNTWLNTLDPAPKVDGMSMLDGYLTAIVVGPHSVPPEEWFVDLLGERGRIATATGKTFAAIAAIVGRLNAISEGLSTAPQQHTPIFEKTDDGAVLAQPWCMGFLAAMRLRAEAWQPLLDLHRIEHGLLLPILLHCVDPLGRPVLGPPRAGPETKAFLASAHHDIPPVIPEIREFWMPQRAREANNRR